jgi:hypothetical protein
MSPTPPEQNAAALAIYRQFAEEAEFGWAGGLAFAPGAVINGKPLGSAGFAARNAPAFRLAYTLIPSPCRVVW